MPLAFWIVALISAFSLGIMLGVMIIYRQSNKAIVFWKSAYLRAVQELKKLKKKE